MRRGDGIYQRSRTWWLDPRHSGSGTRAGLLPMTRAGAGTSARHSR
jgi:hypothetical protein